MRPRDAHIRRPFRPPASYGRCAPLRYADEDACDWLIDLEQGEGGAAAAAPHRRGRWALWRSEPFVDAAESPLWSRVLYLPYLSERANVWSDYTVWRRA